MTKLQRNILVAPAVLLIRAPIVLVCLLAIASAKIIIAAAEYIQDLPWSAFKR